MKRKKRVISIDRNDTIEVIKRLTDIDYNFINRLSCASFLFSYPFISLFNNKDYTYDKPSLCRMLPKLDDYTLPASRLPKYRKGMPHREIVRYIRAACVDGNSHAMLGTSVFSSIAMSIASFAYMVAFDVDDVRLAYNVFNGGDRLDDDNRSLYSIPNWRFGDRGIRVYDICFAVKTFIYEIIRHASTMEDVQVYYSLSVDADSAVITYYLVVRSSDNRLIMISIPPTITTTLGNDYYRQCPDNVLYKVCDDIACGLFNGMPVTGNLIQLKKTAISLFSSGIHEHVKDLLSGADANITSILKAIIGDCIIYHDAASMLSIAYDV